MAANTRTSSPGVRNPTSSGHGGIRCAPNGKNQPMSPASPSSPPSPASIYASSSPASNSSGSGSCSSTPLTPQSPFSGVRSAAHEETISLDTIYEHYLDVAQRLTAERRPSRTGSPCPSPNANTNANPKETETTGGGDPAQDPPSWLSAPDWPELQWMPSGTLTLDELPDSDNWFLPEYQLTQEWFEQTIKYLKKEKEAAEARRHEAEIETEIGAEMDVDVDVETEAGVEPPEGKTARKPLD